LQNPGTAYTSQPFNPQSVFSYLSGKSSSYAQMANAYATSSLSGNVLDINATGGKNSVINLNASTLGSFLSGVNSEIHINNVTGSGTLVINVLGSGGALAFNAKTLGLTATTYDNVVWNFTNMPQLTIGNSVSTFEGSILAGGSSITWSANDLEGQLFATNFTDTTAHEFHDVAFFAGSVSPIPEPATYGLLALLLAAALLGRRACVQRQR
jgi:choice-of-anchor A domain-containing protein